MTGRRPWRSRNLHPYTETRGEYFAECFSAYVFHRKALQKYDPVGYNLVRKVREIAGIEP